MELLAGWLVGWLVGVDQSGSIGYIIQHPLGPTLFHSVYLLFSSPR
jgi:hypothetical protein